ncbi:MAG: hypothetical protein PWP72_145 [Thermoanaerobacter sp.]|nr:hypothetical protein [Thermoanaerobacter sp.]
MVSSWSNRRMAVRLLNLFAPWKKIIMPVKLSVKISGAVVVIRMLFWRQISLILKLIGRLLTGAVARWTLY